MTHCVKLRENATNAWKNYKTASKRKGRGGGEEEEKEKPSNLHRITKDNNTKILLEQKQLSRRGALYTDAVGSQYVRLWRVKKGRKEREQKRKKRRRRGKRRRTEERKKEKEERAKEESNHSTGFKLIKRF